MRLRKSELGQENCVGTLNPFTVSNREIKRINKEKSWSEKVHGDHGKLRDELLCGEIFDTLLKAKVLVERWRQEYNRFSPHISMDSRSPVPVNSSDLAPDT